MQNSGQDTENAVSKAKSRSYLPAVIGIGGVAVLAGIFTWVRAGSLPTISRKEFEAAKTLWSETKPPSYDVVVELKGMQPGVYAVRVENGVAISASFDGRDLKRRRTFGTWSVTGMFDTLAKDLEVDDQHGYLLLKAEFDPMYGFPVKYERMEMRTGVHDTLQWEVTKFEPRN